MAGSAHDVADLEALVGKALDDGLRSMGATLRHHDREDALSFLLAVAWEASLAYDPKRGSAFSSFVHQRFRLRLVDWYRGGFGRTRWTWADHTRERESPEFLSLDGDGGLDAALRGGGLDPDQDRSAALDLRVLHQRARRPLVA